MKTSKWSNLAQRTVLINLLDDAGTVVDSGIVAYAKYLTDRLDSSDIFTRQLEDKNGIVYDVHQSQAKWRVSAMPPPSPCVFDATTQYLKNMFGIWLMDADKQWFNKHGGLLPAGVPTNNTLRVIQELIDPYGLRIAKVRIAPGLHLRGDILQWFGVLGVNPLAATDRVTTNAEFCKQTDLELAEAEAMYSVEYSDDAFRPGIACAGPGDAGGGHGHANYLGFRSGNPHGTVDLNIQLARVSECPWPHDVPVFKELPPRENEMELDIWAMAPQTKANKPRGNSLVFPVGAEQDKCCLCPGELRTRNPAIIFYQQGSLRLCNPCFEMAWDGYSCPGCHHPFSSSVRYHHCTNGSPRASCPKCGKVASPPEKPTSDALRVLIELAGGKMPGKAGRKVFRRHRRVIVNTH